MRSIILVSGVVLLFSITVGIEIEAAAAEHGNPQVALLLRGVGRSDR
jgi:hypothetical protein